MGHAYGMPLPAPKCCFKGCALRVIETIVCYCVSHEFGISNESDLILNDNFSFYFIIGRRRFIPYRLREYDPACGSGNQLLMSDAENAKIFIIISALCKVSRIEKR